MNSFRIRLQPLSPKSSDGTAKDAKDAKGIKGEVELEANTKRESGVMLLALFSLASFASFAVKAFSGLILARPPGPKTHYAALSALRVLWTASSRLLR